LVPIGFKKPLRALRFDVYPRATAQGISVNSVVHGMPPGLLPHAARCLLRAVAFPPFSRSSFSLPFLRTYLLLLRNVAHPQQPETHPDLKFLPSALLAPELIISPLTHLLV